MPMKYSKTMTVVRKVYDNVECALWATLLGFVIYFLIYLLPNLREISARAESIRAAKIVAENSSYCEKWGMKRGTHEHTLCTIDLQELRKKIERELADDASIL